jgi:hypothetical protein
MAAPAVAIIAYDTEFYHLTKVGIEFEVEDDENFGSVQGEIVSIADETKDDVLDELQVLYDELQRHT